ncbi:MAG: hypothetical protein NC911_02625 [Candidatus Omnitrophica bacterium]|nr:hypothetical protein [Candidatus Omnitrophota bacterium]MCM8768565.1 hypothetical protein [Candidatus Omnitrophota bacterium]
MANKQGVTSKERKGKGNFQVHRSLPEAIWKEDFGQVMLWQLIWGQALNDRQLDKRILENRLRLLFRTPPGVA